MERDARQPEYVPPDFVKRPLQLESQINLAFAATFQPADAQALLVLHYLQQLTLGRRFGPNTSDAALRHAEGQRDLVHIILERIEHGRQRKPDIPAVDPAKSGDR